MAVRKKQTEAKTPEAPAFTKDQLLTFDKYRGRRDLLGVLLEERPGLYLCRGGRAGR